MGISAEQLRARFGPPDQEIEETPGVTWRYRPQGCVLDIHMFPRVESQGLYALDVSSRGLPVEDCLRALMSPPVAETPAAPSDKTKDNAVGQTGADTSPRPADTTVSE